MPRDGDGFSRGRALVYAHSPGLGRLADGRVAVLIGRSEGEGVTVVHAMDDEEARDRKSVV